MIEENNAICAKLMALPRSATFERSQRVAFLEDTFTGRLMDFCGFIGHMKATLSTIKLRRDEAVSIMSDIASAALNIGRREIA